MNVSGNNSQLKKELTLLHVYSIATGATIASGFFLLPGIAFSNAGPGMTLSYLIAVIPIIPALFSKSELATAMPRAGGVYFFLDRSMGPLMGTIGGLGTWLVLILKTAFALFGIGAYMGIFFPEISMLPFAIGFAILFGIINLLGAKKTGGFQTAFLFVIISILSWFSLSGLLELKAAHFTGLMSTGYGPLVNTAGLVYVSYVGLSKIASVSEEVKNPEKTIPLAMFLALGTAVVLYVVGTIVMVGVIPAEQLSGNLTPLATGAELLVGKWGAVIMTVAAVFAFLSVANAGVLSASRYPLAMSRDHLMPPVFRKLTDKKIPFNSIFISVSLIIVVLLFLDIKNVAKLAGAFQLLLFALCSLAVIVMRESRIESYDPGFKSPFYPWMQIFGIITPFWIIIEMGLMPSLFSLGLLVIGISWYYYYAQGKVVRDGAIYHIFARLGENRFEGLDTELRGILKEKGLREKDPFDAVIASARIIEIDEKSSFEQIVALAAQKFEKVVKTNAETLKKTFLDGTLVGATPVSKSAALPHLRLPNLKHAEMIIVRSKFGIQVEVDSELPGEHTPSDNIHAFFFLISPDDNPGQHLRLLAQIASHVDDNRFLHRWMDAENEQDIKELLLRDDRYARITLLANSKANSLIGLPINKLKLPDGCLIALIHREGEIIVPQGVVVLKENDRLTIIGYPDGIREVYERYEGFN